MERRRERFHEHLSAMRALWTMDDPEFHGEFVDFDGIDAYPRPVQAGGPPLVLGGASLSALRDAAEFGAGWYGFGQTPDEVAAACEVMDRHAESIGRDLTGFNVNLTPRVRLTRDLVDLYEKAGVDQLVVSVEGRTPEDVRRRIELNAPSTQGIG